MTSQRRRDFRELLNAETDRASAQVMERFFRPLPGDRLAPVLDLAAYRARAGH